MIPLGFVERLQRLERGDDRGVERVRAVQLGDVRLGHAALLRRAVEDGRPILPAHVVTLPVQLGGIVRDREEHLQDAPERDPRRVVAHLDDLGMVGRTAAHRLVVGRGGGAAGIARAHAQHAVERQEHGFGTPEAAAPQDDGGGRGVGGGREVEVGERKRGHASLERDWRRLVPRIMSGGGFDRCGMLVGC